MKIKFNLPRHGNGCRKVLGASSNLGSCKHRVILKNWIDFKLISRNNEIFSIMKSFLSHLMSAMITTPYSVLELLFVICLILMEPMRFPTQIRQIHVKTHKLGSLIVCAREQQVWRARSSHPCIDGKRRCGEKRR